MAYEDEVLADTPLAYWRMDETSLTASPVTLADASGNGRDLPFEYFDFGSDGYNPLGFPSGIETDAGSRSVYISFTRIGFPGTVDWSRGVIPADPWFQLTGDFTIEAWFSGDTYSYIVGAPNARRLVGTDDFFLGMPERQTAADPLWRFGTVVITSDSTEYIARAETLLPEADTFYYLVAVRVLNSISIYVNAQLYATTTLPPLANRVNGSDLYVGAPSRLNSQSGSIDEVAIYDYALGLDRIQAHYEAGLNALALRGRIQARSSFALDSSQTIQPAVFAFRHNWDRPVREELSYNGRIIRSQSGNEQAYVLDEAPRRKISLAIPTNTTEATGKFNSLLWYAGTANPYVRLPLYHYKDRLAADLPSGSTSIPLTTAYLDYDAGAHVILADYGRSFDIEDYETVEIDSVTPTSIELATATENDWPAGTFIMPARRAALTKPITHTIQTSRAADRLIDARIIPDDNPATRNRVTEWTPAATFESIELFNPFTWNRQDDPRPALEHQRVEDVVDFGNGVWRISQPQDAPEEVLTIRYVIEGIDEISAFLGWLDYRQGTTTLFWFPTTRHDFTKVSQSTNHLTIRSINYTTNYAVHDARATLAFISSNGQTIAARRVGTATDNGDGTETLDLTSNVPSANTYSCISWLWLARLDQNTIAIDWITQCVIQVELRIRNVLSSE